MAQTLRLNQIKHYSTVTIENSTALNNQRFGMGIIGFYGHVNMMNLQVNENGTDGMVFSRRV